MRVLEQYLELICDFHNKREYSRAATDMAQKLGHKLPRRTDNLSTSELIKNQRKDRMNDFYLFQTHKLAEILFNLDNKPGLEWGNSLHQYGGKKFILGWVTTTFDKTSSTLSIFLFRSSGMELILPTSC